MKRHSDSQKPIVQYTNKLPPIYKNSSRKNTTNSKTNIHKDSTSNISQHLILLKSHQTSSKNKLTRNKSILVNRNSIATNGQINKDSNKKLVIKHNSSNLAQMNQDIKVLLESNNNYGDYGNMRQIYRNKYFKHKHKISSHRNRLKTQDNGIDHQSKKGSQGRNNKKVKEWIPIKNLKLANSQNNIFSQLDSETNFGQSLDRCNLQPGNTLQDFQKYVKINRQFIHSEINKRNQQKQRKIMQRKHGSAGKTSNSAIGNSNQNKNEISNNQIKTIKNDENRDSKNKLKNRGSKRLLSQNSKNLQLLPRKKFNSAKPKRLKTQIRMMEQDSPIFSQIQRIIQQKIRQPSVASQNPQKNSSSKNYRMENNKNLKADLSHIQHSVKLAKLIQSIKKASPQKSIHEIKSGIQREMQDQVGSSRVILKDQNNYHQWRRVDLNSSFERENYCSFQSSQKSIMPELYSPKNSSRNMNSIKYKQSTFQMQNQRLENFILKNQVCLSKYLESRKQLLNMKNQSLRASLPI